MPDDSTQSALISTKLYPPQSDAASKYQAHILLTQNRKITKEEAVNELIELGAKSTLPLEILKFLFSKRKK